MKNFDNNIRDFSILLGYIKIAMEFESYSNVVSKLKNISDTISLWAKNYFQIRSFDDITRDESLDIYKIIDDIREEKLFNKEIGEEKNIADQILIWYEIVIKNINSERGN